MHLLNCTNLVCDKLILLLLLIILVWYVSDHWALVCHLTVWRHTAACVIIQLMFGCENYVDVDVETLPIHL